MTWGVVAILAGYLGLVLTVGWPGLLLAGAHLALLAVAAWASERRKPQQEMSPHCGDNQSARRPVDR